MLVSSYASSFQAEPNPNDRCAQANATVIGNKDATPALCI